MSLRILFALRRIGPYHHARLTAAHNSTDLPVSESSICPLRLIALETRPYSLEYPWDFSPPEVYPIARLHGSVDPESDSSNASLDQQFCTLLSYYRPHVVVTVGWADRSFQRLVLAAIARDIPLVIVSDSRLTDERRIPSKELIKRLLLRNYSSALVAGRESRDYLECLGFPSAAISQPWDVIDNDFFAKEVAMATNREIWPAAASLNPMDGPHFLCVSRLIAKKNHAGLLAAYGRYQLQGGLWGLRLIGSGPLQDQIIRQISGLPDPARVQLLPFQQLDQLTQSYARASVFVLASHSDQWGLVVNEAMAAGLPVLASHSCGCTTDLIQHGVSGWCFDSDDVLALADLLHLAERQTASDRHAMVTEARLRLSQFSPAAFSQGLRHAAEYALAHPRRSRSGALTAHLLSAARV